MANYSESTLSNWTKPPSNSEEDKLTNSERMVKEAIAACDDLENRSTEVFGQGSYANNTNVRLNSDIDINVRYTGGFYFNLPEGTERGDFGLNNPTSYTFQEYKNSVEKALISKFGADSVKRDDKCIKVLGNSYRIETDVVPTWNYKRYKKNGTFVKGAKFITDSGKSIKNFPKQHISNGREKNKATSRKFKRLTRIYRKVLYKMSDENEAISSNNITSFLLECLVWNIPNKIFNQNDSWSNMVEESIIFLYQNTKDENKCDKWGEVSELLYLFHSGRKWTIIDVNAYLVQMWNYLGYGE